YHPKNELLPRQFFSNQLIQVRIAILIGRKRKFTTVHYTVEGIVHFYRIQEPMIILFHVLESFNHHGSFHRTGGMKWFVCIDQYLLTIFRIEKGHRKNSIGGVDHFAYAIGHRSW